MPASIKNNIIHRVLKIITSGQQYIYTNEQILLLLNSWRRKYTIPQVNYACKIISNDFPKWFNQGVDKNGTVWVIHGNEAITFLRGIYQIEEYKEPIPLWKILIEIAVFSGAVLAATPSIITALDNRKAPILRDSLHREKQRIEYLQQKIKEDLKALELCRDSLEISKNDSSLNILKVKK